MYLQDFQSALLCLEMLYLSVFDVFVCKFLALSNFGTSRSIWSIMLLCVAAHPISSAHREGMGDFLGFDHLVQVQREYF